MSENVNLSTEVVVIGAGPGGYVAAIRAGQHGKDVTLVERDAYGGACLNRGCIPSKALVTVADLVHRARTAEHIGLDATIDVDFSAVQSWQHDVVGRLTDGIEQLCATNGVNLVEGTATFESPHAVGIENGREDGPDRIEFESAIIATGSRPVTIPGFEPDGERVLTSADVFSLEERPDRLVVVGGGYIGMELATVFAKLGSQVTVLEALDRIMPTYEAELVSPVQERANELGVDIHTGAQAGGVKRTDDGVVVTANEDSQSQFETDCVLVAVGREPVTDTLDLDATDVEVTEQGTILTDHHGRTAHDHVHAIGDVTGEPMLAHRASKQGELVADIVANEPTALDYRVVPTAVFTDPEIATVGHTESEAIEEGYDPVVGEFPFDANGRALTLDDSTGFVRIIADSDTERILGGQIVGPEASDLVGELALAIEVGARIEDIAATIHTHPTLSEAVMEAVANTRGEAIHVPNR